MANFSARAPVEPAKGGSYLHDRTRIPAGPGWNIGEIVTANSGYILGVLLAIGACALVFELRDAWESRRDWVPPAALVPAVLGAMALGHLAQRGKVDLIGPPLFLLFFAVAAPILDIWIHHEYPDEEGLQLAARIVGAVALGLAVVWLIIASIYAEAKDPAKAPPGT
jgi:hypothetical protein